MYEECKDRVYGFIKNRKLEWIGEQQSRQSAFATVRERFDVARAVKAIAEDVEITPQPSIPTAIPQIPDA